MLSVNFNSTYLLFLILSWPHNLLRNNQFIFFSVLLISLWNYFFCERGACFDSQTLWMIWLYRPLNCNTFFPTYVSHSRLSNEWTAPELWLPAASIIGSMINWHLYCRQIRTLDSNWAISTTADKQSTSRFPGSLLRSIHLRVMYFWFTTQVFVLKNYPCAYKA